MLKILRNFENGYRDYSQQNDPVKMVKHEISPIGRKKRVCLAKVKNLTFFVYFDRIIEIYDRNKRLITIPIKCILFF